MKVTLSYLDRSLLITDQIRSIQTEHLVDQIEFVIPEELVGFTIGVQFAKKDNSIIGAETLQVGYTSGSLFYNIPIALTIYPHVKFQIIAGEPISGAVWKSKIGHFYFENALAENDLPPATEWEPYPDWMAAIEAAEAATLAANEAAAAANEAAAAANEAAEYASTVTGYVGSAGYTGSQGIQGEFGYTGSIGYTGSQGIQGELGYTGSIGYTGSQGIQGELGYTGSIGYTGSQGIQGEFGYTGSLGYSGSIGYTGSQGVQGETGFIGSQGIQGEIGYTGSTGFTGSQGIQGEQGLKGDTGEKGDKGDTGDAGTITAGSTNTAMTGLIAGDGSKVQNPTATQVGNLPMSDPGNYFSGDDKLLTQMQSAGAQLAQIANYLGTPVATYTYNGNTSITIDSITIGSPGTFNRIAHGLVDGNIVYPVLNWSAGMLYPLQQYPTGLTQTRYYVVTATEDTFQVSLTFGGAAIALSAANDVTKWHFEKYTNISFGITGLPASRKYRMKVVGKSLEHTQYSTYIAINGVGNDWTLNSINSWIKGTQISSLTNTISSGACNPFGSYVFTSIIDILVGTEITRKLITSYIANPNNADVSKIQSYSELFFMSTIDSRFLNVDITALYFYFYSNSGFANGTVIEVYKL